MQFVAGAHHSSRKPWNSRFASLHPRVYLAIHYLVGFVAAGAIAWLIVGVANMVPDKSLIAEIDDAVTNWMTQHGSDGGDSMFSAISLLGGPLLVVIVATVAGTFATRRDWRRFALVAVTCGGGLLLNAVLRETFRRAHPLDATAFVTAAQSWNFPSGHAMNALVCYGVLAYLMIAGLSRSSARSSIGIAAGGLIVLVGFTRIYLGVHFLSDVVTGYAAGAVWLLVCIAAYQFVRMRYVVAGATVSV
ncbi:MAG: phosphatase PAP2 family protein [bacterium]